MANWSIESEIIYSFIHRLFIPRAGGLLNRKCILYDTSFPEKKTANQFFLLKVQRNLWPRVSLDRPDKIIAREPALLFVEERRDRRRKILEMVSRRHLRCPARNQRNETSRSRSFEKGTKNRFPSSCNARQSVLRKETFVNLFAANNVNVFHDGRSLHVLILFAIYFWILIIKIWSHKIFHLSIIKTEIFVLLKINKACICKIILFRVKFRFGWEL